MFRYCSGRASGASRFGGIVLIAGALAVPGVAQAGYGTYIHGYGIQSVGAGGIGYSLVLDSSTLSVNPAVAIELGPRLDLALQYDGGYSGFRIAGNPAGPDERYSSARKHFFTPQAGWVHVFSDRLALGVTGFVAGLGAEYEQSPFERFGGSRQSSLGLGQGGLATALSYAPVKGQAIGASLNLSYQVLEAKGLQGFTAMSESPDHVTNRGKDGAAGVGFTLSWYGELLPQLRGALSYRSKTWTQAADRYKGLLPDQGRFEFPAMWGGGLAWTPRPGWTLAFDYQRVEFASETAFKNSSASFGVAPLGSDGGPGFGWPDQDIYKLAAVWRPAPAWTLRAGYSWASHIVKRSETLFNGFAPSTLDQAYCLGASYAGSSRWEWSGALAYSPDRQVYGQNSIPEFAGGGEADVRARTFVAGIELTRRFGR